MCTRPLRAFQIHLNTLWSVIPFSCSHCMSFPRMNSPPAWAAVSCLFPLGAARQVSFPGGMWTLTKWNSECILLITYFWNRWYILYYVTKDVLVLVEGNGHTPEPWDSFSKMYPFPSLDSAKPPTALTWARGASEDACSFWLFLESREPVRAYTFHRRAQASQLLPRIFNPSCSIDQQREVGLLQASNLCL